MSKVLIRKRDNVIVKDFPDSVSISICTQVSNAYVVSGDSSMTDSSHTYLIQDRYEFELIEDVTLPDDYEVYKYEITNGEFQISSTWNAVLESRARDKRERDAEKSLHKQPYSSWVWNDTAVVWLPPVNYPNDYDDENPNYDWDEDNQTWVER